MILRPDFQKMTEEGISRTRGGDPSAMDKIDEEIEVFPARAGVIPKNGMRDDSKSGISRTRGGDPRGNLLY